MLNLIGRRARRFTTQTQYAAAARSVRNAAYDVLDAFESAADIAVEARRHYEMGRSPRAYTLA